MEQFILHHLHQSDHVSFGWSVASHLIQQELRSSLFLHHLHQSDHVSFADSTHASLWEMTRKNTQK